MEDLSFLDLDLDAAELAGDVTWSPPTVTWFPRFVNVSRQRLLLVAEKCPRKTCSKTSNPPQMGTKQDLNIGDSPGFGGLMNRAKSTTLAVEGFLDGYFNTGNDIPKSWLRNSPFYWAWLFGGLLHCSLDGLI